ncbi:MAG: site-2 protease family protein, partial [Desulfurococcaceae archaeon]
VLEKQLDNELFKKLYRYFLETHSLTILQFKHEKPILRITPLKDQKIGVSKWKWILMAMTTITVFLTGYGLLESFSRLGNIIGLEYGPLEIMFFSISYTFLFLIALGLHEYGHILISRRSGVRIEGPIFIPAPPIQLGFIGTLGAIIFMKTLPPSRKDLARLGISGPLTGFIIATVIGIIGVLISPSIPVEMAKTLVERGEAGFLPFTTLAFELLLLLRADLNEGKLLLIHPLLFITYVLYLVTFLNLLPIGQLDGGHVLRSVLSQDRYKVIGISTPILLLAIGFAMSMLGYGGGYYIFLSMISFFLYFMTGGGKHPGAANQYDDSSCKLCLLLYAILLILTLPVPILLWL